MTISVRMLKHWKYWLDETGNSERHLPKGLLIELEDDVAAVALALQVAEPMRPLSSVQQAMVDAAAAVLAGEEPSDINAGVEPAEPAPDQEHRIEPDMSVDAQPAAESQGRPEELTYDPPRPEPEPDPKMAKGKAKGKKS